jgi:hypothetical protein
MPMVAFRGAIVSDVAAAVRVTEAVAFPLGPVAVTVTDVLEGRVAGAVYRPVELIVPALAVQEVAPAEVNCWDCPTATIADVGEIVCGMLVTRLTVARAYPVELITVMVTVEDAGIVEGAV